MSRDVKIMLLILVSYGISKAWTLLPESEVEYDFFPLHDQRLTLRMHVYFICERAALMTLVWAVMVVTTSPIFHYVFILYALRIVDYLLIYEEAWFRIGPYPIEYGTIMIVLLAILFWKMYDRTARQSR